MSALRSGEHRATRCGGSRTLRAILAAAALLTVLIPGRGTYSGARAQAVTQSEVDFVARRAYETGVALITSRQATAALPHFEQALAFRPDLWQVHGDYASALANAALESEWRRGRWMSCTRSSHERIAMLHQALDRLAGAERLATQNSDLAYLRDTRGRLLRTWAFAWDALAELERATAADPDWEAARQNRLMQLDFMGLPATFEIPAR